MKVDGVVCMKDVEVLFKEFTSSKAFRNILDVEIEERKKINRNDSQKNGKLASRKKSSISVNDRQSFMSVRNKRTSGLGGLHK